MQQTVNAQIASSAVRACGVHSICIPDCQTTGISTIVDFSIKQEHGVPIVQISLMQGRTEEQKAKAAAAITKALHEHLNSTPDHTYVVFQDVAPSNWAISGKLLSEKK